MILTAISGGIVNLIKRPAGAEFASEVAKVVSASKDFGDIKKVDKGRSKKGNWRKTLDDLKINLLTANRQKIRG